MNIVMYFFTQFLASKQDITDIINVRAFIIVIALLLAALGVSILISKKNQLYVKQEKQKVRVDSKSEVA